MWCPRLPSSSWTILATRAASFWLCFFFKQPTTQRGNQRLHILFFFLPSLPPSFLPSFRLFFSELVKIYICFRKSWGQSHLLSLEEKGEPPSQPTWLLPFQLLLQFTRHPLTHFPVFSAPAIGIISYQRS
jgi:hypothetical protein